MKKIIKRQINQKRLVKRLDLKETPSSTFNGAVCNNWLLFGLFFLAGKNVSIYGGGENGMDGKKGHGVSAF